MPNQTVPTGLLSLPPPGPATPVTATVNAASERSSAPVAMLAATGPLTAPFASINSGGTPSMSDLAAFE